MSHQATTATPKTAPKPQQTAPKPPTNRLSTGILQRKCACGQSASLTGKCSDCEEKQLTMQRQATDNRQPEEVPPIVHEVLRSPGTALDSATQGWMAAHLGDDFSQVRIHDGSTNAKAAASTRAVNALAYTVGRDIVFGAGQYAPKTFTGRRLLAHELTHVMQQRRGSPFSTTLRYDTPHSAAEQEADRIATHVTTASLPSQIKPTIAAAPTLHRQSAGEPEPTTEATPETVTAGETETATPEAPPLTREAEIAQSQTTPGEVIGTANPPILSFYNFAIDSAELKTEHQQVIAELADIIRRAEGQRIRVVLLGHTDNSGPDRHNLRLSRQRANAVRAALRGSGARFTIAGLGEDLPATSNDTVEGRSRNRRVDVRVLVPTPPRRRPEPEPEPPGDQPPERDRPPELPDDDWFCIEYPLICAAILLGGATLAALFWTCIRNPLACLPLPGGDGDDDDPERRRRRRYRPRPCPQRVRLPSSMGMTDLMPNPFGRPGWKRFYAERSFNMRLDFINDETGCLCNLGEYKQLVRGYAKRTDANGNESFDRVRLVNGTLDQSSFDEDAREGNPSLPYGHRDNPRGNRYDGGDDFLPDRDDGCQYRGDDLPSMAGAPGEHLHLHLEFRGGAVDRRNRNRWVGGYREWTVDGEATVPGGSGPTPTPPTPTPSTPPPTPQIRSGPSIGPASPSARPLSPPGSSVFCRGGSIGCATVDLLQERQRQEFTLTEDAVRDAIALEARLIEQNIRAVPQFSILAGENYQIRQLRIRQAARRRVLDFAGLSGLYSSDYAN